MSNRNRRVDELIDTLQNLSVDIRTVIDSLAIARDDENEERNPSARPRQPTVGSGNRVARLNEAIAEQRLLSIRQRLSVVSRNRLVSETDESGNTRRPFRVGDKILITIYDYQTQSSSRHSYTHNPRESVFQNRRRHRNVESTKEPHTITE
jgi:hypothetical protein